VPEDNACFFHCVNQACFNNTTTVEQLKQLCARTVIADPFYAPFLETTKEAYAKSVLHPDFWGGHVEQVIFSRECSVEFVVIFSDGRDIRRVSHAITPPTKRVYLEYCGKQEGRFTHYNLFVHGPNDSPCGVFDTNDPDSELAMVLAVELSQVGLDEEKTESAKDQVDPDEDKTKEDENNNAEEEKRDEYRKLEREYLKRQKEELKKQQQLLKRQQEEDVDEQAEDEEEEQEDEKIWENKPIFLTRPPSIFQQQQHRPRPRPFDPFQDRDPFNLFQFHPFGQRLQRSSISGSRNNLRNPFGFDQFFSDPF